ncbi:ABC transporter permease/M1 family aminopeptidase [Pedobacter miscanthi]|uniref:ABC transporter permease/M1 family aminopeptidase n=1 Tax=Pedobacter miscanthi TaxID=2259170 RepID=UPI00292F5E89|nr:M1 family aminopeptidase [Pedobacter miscanthi]
MTGDLLKFELKYHFGQASFKVAALLFFILGYCCVVKGGFGSAEVHKNSPYVIANIMALLSLFSIFSGTIFSTNVVLRDEMYRMESVIFTTSINKRIYFGVRFLGLLLAVFSLYILVIIGIFIGSFFIDADRLGPFNLAYFLQPLFAFALPNALFAAGALFCTAILTKSVRAIYVIGVLIYILYMLASIFGNSPLLATSAMKATGPDVLPLLLDPFALASFFGETRTWTDLQRNQQLFPVEGVFLFNRLLWIGVTALITLVTYRFFHFRLQRERKTKTAKSEQIAFIPYRVLAVLPNGFRYCFSILKAQFKLEMIFLFKNIPIMIMLLLWVFLYGVELKDQLFSGIYGIHSYPATGIIIEEMRSMKFGLILILFYGAETICREKSVNIHALIYSTPVQNSAMWMAKYLSLSVLVFTLVTLNIGIGIVLQVTHGYFHIELPLYFTLYYYSALPMLLFVVLLVFIQNLSANKYLGMVLSMLMVFLISYAERFGMEHYLLRFATVPDLLHSYFNGFGYYAKAFNWYMLYWAALAVVIAVLTISMWQNKVEIKVINQFQSIGKVLKQYKWITLSAFLIWISAGAFIYHQTNIIGKYQNKQAQLEWHLAYEKKYKAFANLPQPVIKSIKTEVDLYPNEGKYSVKGTYQLKNETQIPISKIWTYVSPEVNSFSAEIAGGRNKMDKRFGQQVIDLKNPLQPDELINMDFSIEVIRTGFTAFDKENAIVKNGTYIELEKFVPHFGYCYYFESDNKAERKKAGLTKVASPPIYNRTYELINLETIISTEADQKVITVGELQKEWTTNNRRYFNYKTTQPINFMFAVSSAKYAVKKKKYKGIDLSIYYQPGQEYNLESMFIAVKDALDYGDANFSKYPLTQLTIAEIPQYKGAATAYPGVVFSAEDINFLGNFSQNGVIDQSYAIAAHETAHQWWANKLSPMDGAGYAMLTESLAKYTENVLIEKRFGKMYLQKYLTYDNGLYFLNRNNNEKELPLAKTLDQPYVHYQKGGLIMYAVKELIGVQAFNTVLHQLIINHEYPKTKATAADFVNALLNQALPEQKKFINDCFNQVVTYDLGIKVLACKALKYGKYKIDVEISAERLSDGGKQAPDLEIDLACFNQLERDWNVNTKPIYLGKYHIKQNSTKISIVVNHKPKIVAIDPYRYLLDADRSGDAAVLE